MGNLTSKYKDPCKEYLDQEVESVLIEETPAQTALFPCLFQSFTAIHKVPSYIGLIFIYVPALCEYSFPSFQKNNYSSFFLIDITYIQLHLHSYCNYLFHCWWAYDLLFLFLDIPSNVTMNLLTHILVQVCFHFLECIPRG